jgi:hypothetical protein
VATGSVSGLGVDDSFPSRRGVVGLEGGGVGVASYLDS